MSALCYRREMISFSLTHVDLVCVVLSHCPLAKNISQKNYVLYCTNGTDAWPRSVH